MLYSPLIQLRTRSRSLRVCHAVRERLDPESLLVALSRNKSRLHVAAAAGGGARGGRIDARGLANAHVYVFAGSLSRAARERLSLNEHEQKIPEDVMRQFAFICGRMPTCSLADCVLPPTPTPPLLLRHRHSGSRPKAQAERVSRVLPAATLETQLVRAHQRLSRARKRQCVCVRASERAIRHTQFCSRMRRVLQPRSKRARLF